MTGPFIGQSQLTDSLELIKFLQLDWPDWEELKPEHQPCQNFSHV